MLRGLAEAIRHANGSDPRLPPRATMGDRTLAWLTARRLAFQTRQRREIVGHRASRHSRRLSDMTWPIRFSMVPVSSREPTLVEQAETIVEELEDLMRLLQRAVHALRPLELLRPSGDA